MPDRDVAQPACTIETILPITQDPRVRPLVLRIRAPIDQAFTRYVGPIAGELCDDEFKRWRDEGPVGPLALHRYISRLARYISDEALRRSFISEASKCIQIANIGKTR